MGEQVNGVIADQLAPRSFGRRIGFVALNLMTPGLGLFRLGSWRAGMGLLVAAFAVLVVITIGMEYFPITSYSRVISALVLVLALTVVQYAVAGVLTWRRSRFSSPTPWWSRWYGLAAIAIGIALLLQLMQALMHGFYKPFYAPSESMAPTIGNGDKFIADMRWRGPFRRGEVVIFKGPDSTRVSRIAAIPGDRIAMRGGLPIVNGVPAVQMGKGQVAFTG